MSPSKTGPSCRALSVSFKKMLTLHYVTPLDVIYSFVNGLFLSLRHSLRESRAVVFPADCASFLEQCLAQSSCPVDAGLSRY